MKQNVPALRFVEFEGEWEEKRLGDVVKLSSAKYNPITEQEVFKCIELEHLASDAGELLGYSSSDSVNSIKNRFNEGDVLFGKLRPYLKKYLQAPFDGVCSSEVWVLRGEGIANEFLYRIVQTENFIERANQSTGSKMPRADWSVVSESNVSIPSLPEQQKIASFLTAVDVRLQLLRQKKALMEEYKKGLMQRIFSQEVRFKKDDGGEFEEWEEKSIAEISIKKSSPIAANSIEENFGNYIIYGASGILKRIDFYQEEDDYISIVKDGAGVGRLFYCKGQSSVLGTMDIIKPEAGVDSYFLYYLLQTIDFSRFITGSTIPHIYYKDYSKERVGVPCLEEQLKISCFLSAVDEKINLVAAQIAQTETWKKGLMQGMFV